MTNLASCSGNKATSSSKNPSSLISVRLGGVTLIVGSAGIGGRFGAEVDEEPGATVVALRRNGIADRDWRFGRT